MGWGVWHGRDNSSLANMHSYATGFLCKGIGCGSIEIPFYTSAAKKAFEAKHKSGLPEGWWWDTKKQARCPKCAERVRRVADYRETWKAFEKRRLDKLKKGLNK